MISILCSCSGAKQNISSRKQPSRPVISDRDVKIIEHNRNYNPSRPDWVGEQEDGFLYLHKSVVLNSDDNYPTIIDSLSRVIISSFSESLQISVIHETYKKVSENNTDLKEYYESVTSTFSSATLFGDEFDISIFPDEVNYQPGDTVWADGRLNQRLYQSRFESQLTKHQEEAERHLNASIQALEEKSLEYCLYELTRSKYYIDRGGGGAIIHDMRDGGTKSINKLFKEFLAELTDQFNYEITTPLKEGRIVFVTNDERH